MLFQINIFFSCKLKNYSHQIFVHVLCKMEFDILGVDVNCTLDDARHAINKIRLAHHPDRLRDIPEKEREKNQQFLIFGRESVQTCEEQDKSQ